MFRSHVRITRVYNRYSSLPAVGTKPFASLAGLADAYAADLLDVCFDFRGYVQVLFARRYCSNIITAVVPSPSY